MAKKIKHKTAHTKTASDEHHHGDISYRHMTGKPQAPQDHKATSKKGATQDHNGTQLGQDAPQPSQNTGGYESPSTMQGPMDYPGQDIGA